MKFWQDLMYAGRLLGKTPGYTAICLAVVIFSIAISLVIFSFNYRAIWKPLDMVDSSRWHMIQSYDRASGISQGFMNVDLYTYQEIQNRELSSLEDVYAYWALNVTLSDGQTSHSLRGVALDPELLDLLEVQPALGRLLSRADIDQQNVPVTMISHHAWKTYYQADPNIVGKSTRLNDKATTIVGVMPERFSFVLDSNFWLPLNLDSISTPNLSSINLAPIVKLKTKQSTKSATGQLDALQDSIQQEYPEIYSSSTGLQVVPLKNATWSNVYAIFSLMAIVTIILTFFSCLNIGILILTRTFERRQELAIRSAVGSSRLALVKNTLIESFIICFTGGLLGLLLAQVALLGVTKMMQASNALQGNRLPQEFYFSLDLATVLVTIITMVIIWLVSGVLPALKGSKLDLSAVLASGAKGVGKGGNRISSVFISFQLIFAFFLVFTSGVLIVSINEVINTDYGTETENRATAAIALYEESFSTVEQDDYFSKLQNELSNVSGVRSVAFSTALPGATITTTSIQLNDRSLDPSSGTSAHPVASVSDNYFDLMGVNIIEGRNFNISDNRESLAVAILDANLANIFWPQGNAIGKQIRIGPEQNSVWVTIVGVSDHVFARQSVYPDTQFFIYRPLQQSSVNYVRTILNFTVSLPDIRESILTAATRANRNLPLIRLQTMGDFNKAIIGGIDVFAAIFSGISIIALILAATGVYAVMARSIVQHIRDIGIQRALGSNQQKIISIYVRKGIKFLLASILFGGLPAFLLLGLLFSQNIASQSQQPIFLLFLVVTGCLVLIVLAASYFPTRRAIALEPGDALRYE